MEVLGGSAAFQANSPGKINSLRTFLASLDSFTSWSADFVDQITVSLYYQNFHLAEDFDI